SAEASESAVPLPAPVASALPVERRGPPPILAPVPLKFSAVGTEPFWSASVEGAKLSYATPETPDGVAVTVTRKAAGAGVVYTGAIDGKPLELEVRRETCFDGMSDTVYPFAVVRRIGPDSQRGCAR
ncbi:MAG: COG3650 family protein, partial [Novosphingobium sp.]